MNCFTRLSNEPAPLACDPCLAPYRDALAARTLRTAETARKLTGGRMSLADFASGHEYFGLHRDAAGWVFREWAPNATRIIVRGDFTNWEERPGFVMKSKPGGAWELRLPAEALRHGDHYLLSMEWEGGRGDRVPAYARCVVQDEATGLFSAVVYAPERPYAFRHPSPPAPAMPLVYESHVGMAQEEPKVGSFAEFRVKTLPRIAKASYNTIQLMAVMGHPYYGSFGYHVANFFAVAGRFGTPDEFKELVDAAHGLGLRVIIDLVHSHATRNEVEGLGRYDGSRTAFFHAGARGEHAAWDSLLFDYAKPEVLHFLLSNCRYWLDEFRIDGFRFDGVTSMMYLHHGLGKTFTSYADYFGPDVDEDAVCYLGLANTVIHTVRPDAVTVAEDVSGMPGLAAPLGQPGGIGFDYRLAMGVTDMWFKLFDIPDENWPLGWMYHELCNRRRDERSISYAECHDQAIVGGKTAIFRLADAAMYDAMHVSSASLAVDRAVALHKMMRLATLASAGHGYLNFMGNEFGHPEWIDFPREGNHWSMMHARRLWSLAENPDLRYRFLAVFDRAMLETVKSRPEFTRCIPQLVRLDETAKILIFERDDLYFCFNFHPERSYFDYAFEVREGVFETVLDSDAPEFGGFARREPGQTYFTRNSRLSLYLPNRSALVLKRR